MIPASKWVDGSDLDIPTKIKEKIKSFFEYKRGLEEKHGYTRSRIINMDETRMDESSMTLAQPLFHH